MAFSQSSTRCIIRSELVEVIIPANGGQPKTKIQLPDNQNLRNSYIMGIETYTVDTIPLSIVTKTVVVGFPLIQSVFLTLQDYQGVNFLSQMPVVDFLNLAPITLWSEYPTRFGDQKVNYPKSYIEIADSSLISTTEKQTVLLNIFYRYFDEKEKEARQATFKNRK